jgi:hypothetical protein
MKAYLVFRECKQEYVGEHQNSICSRIEEVIDMVDSYLGGIEESDFSVDDLRGLDVGQSLCHTLDGGEFICIHLVDFDPEIVVTVDGDCVTGVDSCYSGLEYKINKSVSDAPLLVTLEELKDASQALYSILTGPKWGVRTDKDLNNLLRDTANKTFPGCDYVNDGGQLVGLFGVDKPLFNPDSLHEDNEQEYKAMELFFDRHLSCRTRCKNAK